MKTRLNKILSIILVAVMLVTAAPLSGFMGFKIEQSSFSTKASATTFLTEQEAERFLKLFLEAGSASWEAAENALTGKEEGSSETWKMIGEGVESFADLTADVDWGEIIPTGSSVSGTTIGYITGAVSGVLQIIDSCEGILDNNSSMRKSINGFRLIEGCLKFIGKGSLVPSTLSIVLTTVDVALDIASFLEERYFEEALTLYEGQLLIEYHGGFPLTRMIARDPLPTDNISQAEAQYIYDSIFFKYYCKQRVDSVGAGSGGGSVDVPVEYIEMLFYSYELLVDETINNPATVYPTNATDKSLTYSSSNTSVATVDSNGNITAKGGGSTVITAKASNGVTNYCEITVFPFKASIVNGTYQIDEYVGNGGDVTIPDKIRGVRVTTIGVRAFFCCNDLTSVTIFDGVNTIEAAAFARCNKLTSVTIGNSVTSIGESAFYNCENLISATIGDSVTTIGEDAFAYCYNFTSVTIGKSVTTIGDCAFTRCDKLTNVIIPDSVTTIGTQAFCACFDLTSVTIGNGVTTIGLRAFDSCTSLTSVTIGNSVTTIGKDAFSGTSLKSVVIPDSVTTIGSCAFYYCTDITSVTIGNGVTSIGDSAFNGCDNLTSVTIPDSVTTIGVHAFAGCDSLTSLTVDIDNQYYSSDSYGVLYNKNKTKLVQYPIGNERTLFAIPDSVTSIEKNAFNSCINLTDVTIPDSVTIIGVGAFSHCTNLTSAAIGNGVTTIGDAAFAGCANLTSVTIPDSVTTIGYNVFYGCTNLISIIIGNGVTAIGNNAFRDCTSLTSITIPDSVTTIGDYAFDECRSLTDVCFRGTQSQWNNISVGEYNENLINAVHFKHTHSFDWTVNSQPSSTKSGVKTGFCSACNGCTFCSGACEVELPAIEFSSENVANIDFDSNTISGFNAGATSIDDYVSVKSDGYSFTCDSAVIGTGTVIELTDGETVITEFTAVVFGDVNGDGWYDGTDSIIVSCLANGLLSKDDVSPAFYTAADCNHDGVIDSFDVAILEQAGLLLSGVDQSKSNEELATDEAFIEYLDLIDQTPDEDVVEEEETPQPEEDVETPETEELNLIEFIITIIKKLFELLISYLPIK